ncbi:MAG: YdeI/OmpD-associated family protein [Candidatus Aminicenantes bacterium]|nr:YdeI/OmpD-associated family protein [Candidatus Aminicenantes bacterium]
MQDKKGKRTVSVLHVKNRNEWRTWLEKHFEREKAVWLIFNKKHTGKPCVPYEDAVEEAICFGWIDSIVKRMDEKRFCRKFTPRTNTGKWSQLNKMRAKKMMKEGKMIEAGLDKINLEAWEKDAGKSSVSARPTFSLSAEMEKELKKNKKAWANFNTLASSHKRNYIGWIMSAKKEETRQRRFKEAVSLLAKNKKLGLK